MDYTEAWQNLQTHWWWIHSLLVGLTVGGSLGIWAYRELWYGLSTFFSSPVETRSPLRALVQFLASLLLLIRSGLEVGLILTWPWVLQRYTEEGNRWIAIGAAFGVWALLRLLLAFGSAKKPAPPKFFKQPFRWAYYRSVQTPDSLVTSKVDVFLGAILHVGLALIWYEYRNFDEPVGWWYTAAIAGSVGVILIATSISVLIHPTPVSHQSRKNSDEKGTDKAAKATD